MVSFQDAPDENIEHDEKIGGFFIIIRFVFYGVVELFCSILTLNQFKTNAFAGFSDVILFDINDVIKIIIC